MDANNCGKDCQQCLRRNLSIRLYNKSTALYNKITIIITTVKYSVNLFAVNIQLFRGRFNAHTFYIWCLLSSSTIGINIFLHSFQIIVSDFVDYTDDRT